MSNNLQLITFGKLDIDDPFFDSLKEDYDEFEEWFLTKAKDRPVYVQLNDNGTVNGLLAVKIENGKTDDVTPPIYAEKILKISTFKINPHGTRLGERFIKKALDRAVIENATVVYVSIFPKHSELIKLLEKYGFEERGIKITEDGQELVLAKNLVSVTGNIYKDYPLININGNKKYLLSIYPKYHTNMFPDSILNNETVDILADVSHTNSIHKIYVCRMKVGTLHYGDIIVIYRTKSEGRSAEYSAVATSICVVEEVKHQSEFNDFKDFYEYASSYSVLDRDDLLVWYKRGDCFAIKMTYNAALSKRLTRHKLIEEIDLDRDEYWGFFQISDNQLKNIIKAGGVSEGLIIN